MNSPQIRLFLRECIVWDETTDDALDLDAAYGLYVSWCVLNRKIPVPDHTFRTALHLEGIRPRKQGRTHILPGLRMTGPAATDYILNSSPNWAEGDPIDGQPFAPAAG